MVGDEWGGMGLHGTAQGCMGLHGATWSIRLHGGVCCMSRMSSVASRSHVKQHSFILQSVALSCSKSRQLRSRSNAHMAAWAAVCAQGISV